MTWIDAAIVIIFLFFIVTAFQGGLVREMIAFAATLAGIILAGLFYDDLRDSLLGSIDNTEVANAVSFLVIFITITVAGQLLAMVVHPMIQILQLGIMDQFLGAGFGVLKAFILVQALLIVMVTYPFWDLDTEIAKSEFATRLLDVSQPITRLLPDIFKGTVEALDGPTGPLRDS